MHNIKRLSYIAFAANIVLAANAQNNIIKSPSIYSLQVVAGNRWMSLPVVNLHEDVPVNISFDDLTHEYHRFAYRLVHCEADWSESDGIFESDFCEGFADGNTIDDAEESINTNTQYTHYSFTIPNDKCRPKISGNYKLHVYDDISGDTVLTACFMVVEQKMNVSLAATSNTDIDTNSRHQQVKLGIDYNGIRITNPENEIKAVVLQNGDWTDARICNNPQLVNSRGIAYEHARTLIFNGGNEFHKFEILDVSHPTLGIEDVWWDGENYNAKVWTDLPRPNYTYDEDANGAFYIRNSDNIENDRASEYVTVEFNLQAPRQKEDVYINGSWTFWAKDRKYRLEYDEPNGMYHTRLKLKQGYYSYRYITTDSTGKNCPVSSEGNFFQTENTYQALVYYRGTGMRTDQLVGYKSITFK